MKKIVNKEVLDLYDKYEGDLGLLNEPWASKKDREKISIKQSRLLGEYIDQLYFMNVKKTSKEMKDQTTKRIIELEKFIDDKVIDILKARIETS